eukprot:1154983-Pelagomonas_calceolata.AAC.4
MKWAWAAECKLSQKPSTWRLTPHQTANLTWVCQELLQKPSAWRLTFHKCSFAKVCQKLEPHQRPDSTPLHMEGIVSYNMRLKMQTLPWMLPCQRMLFNGAKMLASKTTESGRSCRSKLS